jgi:biotin-dependent carboxylase-like uncharacterized protein
MDRTAAEWALRLIDTQSANAVLIEVANAGFSLRMESNVRVAITGADAVEGYRAWHCHLLKAGDRLNFVACNKGQWTYLAFDCGIHAQRWLGSASVNPTAGMGVLLKKGDRLYAQHSAVAIDKRIVNQYIRPQAIADYFAASPIPVETAPQSDWFDAATRNTFFASEWHVSADSNRMGIRLQGPALLTPGGSLLSEPVRVGSIQVPANGQPIIMGPDGPTVGGYPKIGWLSPQAFNRLVQCRPGDTIRFSPCNRNEQ